jgi:hypothetical protein
LAETGASLAISCSICQQSSLDESFIAIRDGNAGPAFRVKLARGYISTIGLMAVDCGVVPKPTMFVAINALVVGGASPKPMYYARKHLF